MGRNSGIAWTDHTFNSHWGCEEVSPGCDHCYAKAWAKRTGADLWGAETERRFFSDRHWAAPRAWNAAAAAAGVRARVFCASMGDVFEDRRDLDPVRARLWPLIEATPALDWQLLTKRPENLRAMLPAGWLEAPRPNVWLGVTGEDQQRADERLPLLLATPAAVRFVSVEPQLGPVDLRPYLYERRWDVTMLLGGVEDRRVPALSWVICGGESQGGARPFDLGWALDLREQCKAAHVPFFMKQLGAMPVVDPDHAAGLRTSRRLPMADRRVRVELDDKRHGADVGEFPDILRVREFPQPREAYGSHSRSASSI